MPAGRPKKTSGGPATAFQQIQDQLKWVDLVIEVRDARVPDASRHPQSDSLFGGKPRLVVLAKDDLADQGALREWLAGAAAGSAYLPLDLKFNRGKDKLVNLALKLTQEKRARLAGKGLLPRPLRACVVGMPNVGKSSLINWLIGRKKAAVGDRPGITRGKQWVRLHPQLELLDTPGILPPVAFTESTGLRLALLNLLPEHSYDFEDTARQGLELLFALHPQALSAYAASGSGPPTLESIAGERRWLSPGGYPDSRRAAQMFLRDLRAGQLGRVMLDRLKGDRT